LVVYLYFFHDFQIILIGVKGEFILLDSLTDCTSFGRWKMATVFKEATIQVFVIPRETIGKIERLDVS
jgi:hypothetical protein